MFLIHFWEKVLHLGKTETLIPDLQIFRSLLVLNGFSTLMTDGSTMNLVEVSVSQSPK